jgi:succinoglycan biosynthesis transport protein ExoP
MNTQKQYNHLRDYLRIIKKHRKTSGLFFAVTFGVVVLGTFIATPLYEGTCKVIIEKVEASDLAGRYRPAPYDPEFYETQFQLIKSQAVSRRVVEMLSLADSPDGLVQITGSGVRIFPEWTKDLLGKIKESLSLGNHDPGQEVQRSKEDLLAQAISEKISVRPISDSHIVLISFLSSNPELAASVANATAKAYIEEILNMKMDASRRTLSWMTSKAETERHKLEKSENALQDYMKANDIVTLEDKMTITPEKLSEITTQLVRAEAKRKELEALYQKVRQATRDDEAAETIAAIASDPALMALRAEIVESEKSVMELSGKYGPKHPLMAKALGDLKILRQKKAQEIRRLILSIKNEYELALTNENNIRSQLQQSKNEALALNEKFIQYGALKREVDTNRGLYDALIKKIKEQSITEETQPVNLSIVEDAPVPLTPARPLKSLNLLLGLVLGTFGGIGFALVVEYLDNTIRNPEDAEAVLGTPVLGLISLYKGDRKLDELVLKEPQSIFSENFRALRTSVLLSSADSPPGSILITSSGESEGKTTLSVNLALVLAQLEKKVVLIDGDLRKPNLHKFFKMNNENGLSNFLAGVQGKDILKKGPLPNLAIVTSGPIPPNPSELLVSSRFQALVEGLKKEFDVVICDSPPLLPVADARVLSRTMEKTILVAKANKTPYDLAARALKTLTDINVHVLGIVINGFDQKKSGYYNYDYSSYHQENNKGAVPREA